MEIGVHGQEHHVGGLVREVDEPKQCRCSNCSEERSSCETEYHSTRESTSRRRPSHFLGWVHLLWRIHRHRLVPNTRSDKHETAPRSRWRQRSPTWCGACSNVAPRRGSGELAPTIERRRPLLQILLVLQIVVWEPAQVMAKQSERRDDRQLLGAIRVDGRIELGAIP